MENENVKMDPLTSEMLDKVSGGKGSPYPKFNPGDKVRYWDDDEWVEGTVQRFYVDYYDHSYTYNVIEKDGSVTANLEESRIQKL